VAACRLSFRLYCRFGCWLIQASVCLISSQNGQNFELTVVDILQIGRLMHIDIYAPRVYQYD